ETPGSRVCDPRRGWVIVYLVGQIAVVHVRKVRIVVHVLSKFLPELLVGAWTYIVDPRAAAVTSEVGVRFRNLEVIDRELPTPLLSRNDSVAAPFSVLEQVARG